LLQERRIDKVTAEDRGYPRGFLCTMHKGAQ